MAPEKKKEERFTRDSLFKEKLSDIRKAERKKTEETRKVLNAQSQLASTKTIMPPEGEVSTGRGGSARRLHHQPRLGHPATAE